ncbi:BamA/OMP85 family outer membrane protein [Synoicihabitans lomoniglobus]|uniref:BamA/TamA family outer membrane protein n=1 Tax=Synoicihabitans lomoniglobus TaxID=2909285 RepID=A0AAF0CQK1_9BACT|nr:BamA/TamA family outer membrane protein [Opitutaceae bacterium LMO-M01]WED66243.1 BamA/TamA family outer membrane protein [Opitutaceae bacterium LMO-M01]
MRSARRCLAVGLLATGLATAVAAQPEITVDGTGWLKDGRIERAVRSLNSTSDATVINANAVEDAVFFAISAVAEDGYLKPTVEAQIERENGESFTHEFDESFANLLPRPLRAVRVDLQVKRGVRYYFDAVIVEGVEPLLAAEDAGKLVVPQAGILALARERVFTPDRLRTGLDQIELALHEKGYAESRTEVVREQQNDETGAVNVSIRVTPGPRWEVGEVTMSEAAEGVVLPSGTVAPGTVWTIGWEQDLVESVRRAHFVAGYPDVRITTHRSPRAPTDASPEETDRRIVAVAVTAVSGPQVTLLRPEFEGAEDLSRGILNRRVVLGAGEPLNPLLIDESRRRLGRLRSLAGVRVDFEPSQGDERAPVFHLESREPWESSLMFGYGSYEQVRAGFEVRGYNLMRRSHQLRLEAVGSLKSLRSDMVYTVPDLFGETIDANFRLFGLDREELSFQRQEYGATIGLTRRDIPWFSADTTVSYTYQDLLNRENNLATRDTDLTETTTASLTVTMARDRRDNPLNPRKGYRWFAQVEAADRALGGEVGFQRVELGYAWHRPWGDTRWLHVGLSHGSVFTFGETNDLALPVNKRFFPGGENSLRGMQSGEASPRNAGGEFIGAKSFTLVNVELEQALTRRISAVVFWDFLGATAELEDLPWSYDLHTVGAGLRYQTIIGPVRIEYGHNLNPRPLDPKGTLHFSLGFPF